MNRTLSSGAKRYIENAVIATTSACNAAENAKAISDIVNKIERRGEKLTAGQTV